MSRHRTGRASATVLTLAVLGAAGCTNSPTPPQPGQGSDAQPFDSYRLADGGREVVAVFWGAPEEPGPCGADYDAVASETSDRVYIRVHVVRHHQGAGRVACPAIAQQRTATVRLAAPLGARAVVDGTTGDMLIQPSGTP